MPPQNQNSKDQPPRGLVFSLIYRWQIRKRSRALMRSREIISTSDGLELHALGKLNWSLRWEDVTGVVAYKRDCYSVDQVCVGFRILDDNEHYFVIDEDQLGYRSILNDLDDRTDGAWSNKFNEVILPPFKTCWTEIWVATGTPSLRNDPYLYYIDPESVSDF